MLKRRIIPMVFMLLLYFSAGELTRMTPFQSCILARDSGGSVKMREFEKRKRYKKMSLPEFKRQEELRLQRLGEEFRRKTAEWKRENAQKRKQQRLERDQRRKEFKKEREEAGGSRFLFAKYALEPSDEQWKLIRPKLEKVDNLGNQAHSIIGYSISSSSTSGQTEASVLKFQWDKPWKNKPLSEMTEAQKLARQIRILLEKKDTPPEVFRRKIAALRKARGKEAEIRKQFAEARRELREILTTRQEAILILLQWL